MLVQRIEIVTDALVAYGPVKQINNRGDTHDLALLTARFSLARCQRHSRAILITKGGGSANPLLRSSRSQRPHSDPC
jgi:hypothetical protein